MILLNFCALISKIEDPTRKLVISVLFYKKQYCCPIKLRSCYAWHYKHVHSDHKPCILLFKIHSCLQFPHPNRPRSHHRRTNCSHSLCLRVAHQSPRDSKCHSRQRFHLRPIHARRGSQVLLAADRHVKRCTRHS